ncbi:TolC family protein [Burkholderia sp. 3C]
MNVSDYRRVARRHGFALAVVSLLALPVPHALASICHAAASQEPGAAIDAARHCEPMPVLPQSMDATRDIDVAPATEADLRGVLYAATEAAVDLNPTVRQMYAEYQAAQSDVDQAKGARWPQLQLTGQTRDAQFGSNAGSTYNPGNSVSVNLRTMLFDWGRTSKTIGSRSESAVANQERYVAQIENSAYQVSSTLVELAKQRNVAALSQRFVDRMTRLVAMLESIVAVDRGRGSELTQARARLLQAIASRDSALSKCRDAELNLRKLVGTRPVPVPVASTWPLQPQRLDALMSSLDENPRLLQARAEANAADLNRDAVKASAKPQLDWVVSTNTGRDVLGRRMPWQTMLTLTWSAFNGGASTAASEAASYRAIASHRQADQTRLDLEYQLRTSEHNARTYAAQSEQYRALSVESDQVRQAFYDQWYHLGKRSLLDVLIAENDYYNNRVNEIAYRFEGYAATLQSYASAGVLMRWLRDGVAA